MKRKSKKFRFLFLKKSNIWIISIPEEEELQVVGIKKKQTNLNKIITENSPNLWKDMDI